MRRRGFEFREMMAFTDEPQDIAADPCKPGEWVLLRPGQQVLNCAWMPSIPKRPGDAVLDVHTLRFKVQRRSEGRVFYGGANWRMRKLSPVLVQVDASGQGGGK